MKVSMKIPLHCALEEESSIFITSTLGFGVFFKKPKLIWHEAKSQRADLHGAGACQVRFAAFAERKAPCHQIIFSLLNLILQLDRV
jgi:hypothetical protein